MNMADIGDEIFQLNNTDNDLNDRLNGHMLNEEDHENPMTSLRVRSLYYDIDGLISNYKVHLTKTKVKVLHLNIQSLSAKFDKLKLLLSTLGESGIHLDFILLCETFLHSGNVHLFDIPGYNLIHKDRQNMTRGGVAIYIKDSIDFK